MMMRELQISTDQNTVVDIAAIFAGDHELHHVDLSAAGLLWDPDSLVLYINMDERHATNLFLELMTILPKLRNDRR